MTYVAERCDVAATDAARLVDAQVPLVEAAAAGGRTSGTIDLCSGTPGAGNGSRADASAAPDGPATTSADLRGGDGIVRNGSFRCSAGFILQYPDGGRSLLTAGHCGTGTWSVNGEVIGTTYDRRYGPDDFQLVGLDNPDGVQALPEYWSDGGPAPVRGWVSPWVGAVVCKSGSTSGWSCGEITETGVTETYQGECPYGRWGPCYPAVTVNNLIRATTCNSGGDSGGPLVTADGGYAVGIVEGKTNAGCGSGGRPDAYYYYPVENVLWAVGGDVTVQSAWW